MRRLSYFIIAIVILLGGITSTYAAVAALKLKTVSALEQTPPGKVTVKYAFTRTVSDSEDTLYTVVLRDSEGREVLRSVADKGVPGGQFIDVAGRTDDVFYVELIKRVPGRTLPIQINAFKTNVRASIPSPDPADPDLGDDGTTINGADKCYRFKNTLFNTSQDTDGICAQDFLTRAYLWAVGIAIIGAAGMIIYAGYRYAVSRGNPADVNNAREIIVSTLVGLALLVLSYTILQYFGVRVQTPDQSNPATGTTIRGGP